MKTKLALATALFLVLSGSIPASGQDAFVPESISSPEGVATFLLGEAEPANHFSTLQAKGSGSEGYTRACDSVNDPECLPSKTERVTARSILRVCTSLSESNCIVRLEIAGADGVFHLARFIRYTKGMNFPPNAATGFMGGTTPSLWSVPQVPSKSGNSDYALIVRAETQMDWRERRFRTSGVTASLRPFRTQQGEYKSPWQTTVESNHRGQKGFTEMNVSNDCAWSEEGACGVLQDFAPTTRVRLTIRITSEVGGWFKGRITNPLISISSPRPGVNEIVVEAAPAEVSRMAYQTSIKNLSTVEKEYALENSTSGKLDQGFKSWARASESSSFGYINYFRYKTLDKSAGVNTFWNFSSSGPQKGNSCLTDTSKVLGIVTTNAMAFDGGAPKFQKGFLKYQVAGLHYQPDGVTKVQGSYDLLIRSDVARCLYGFAKAPLGATVSIVGAGDRSVATTVVSEKNGWLKLAAYGFTFSKKTIKVKVFKANKLARSDSQPFQQVQD